MYSILVVDDEPLICKGLSALLGSSGLSIDHIFTANSGYEALDYLRMEDIDLLITDIQMGEMSGIELMNQARLIKPWVQTIVISAHEAFQYAQSAIRLGAKDYLIKPLNSGQFLDSVRDVLLKISKPAPAPVNEDNGASQPFRMDAPTAERTSLLNRLISDADASAREEAVKLLAERCGLELKGPYYTVISVLLHGEGRSASHDELLNYGALNLISELCSKEARCSVFFVRPGEIAVIAEWDEALFADMSINKVNQLDMMGQSIHFNLNAYLRLQGVVGISQILRGQEFLYELYEQSSKAVFWHKEHPDHYVFYYGDFKWNLYKQPETTEELHERTNQIVEQAKAYIDEHFMQKGLTLHEVANRNHVSPNYLSYLFKKNMDCNLWEYVIKLRMELAKSLLLNSDLRRYEIAERVGYESPEHFSKIFKKYYGMSPSEMKK
ncbi:response regulator transcription factor [Paenibacillus protaetiae]|uniref:Response regulator n=1 Tax=Paenibacillus protaetiae TaxID=2509456 RepID=A0A4P6EY25_9BACL|nr:response regulator [Paenibacillus protaetiae]QAY67974.1 response regulator [Paenibacillus protaetiae]